MSEDRAASKRHSKSVHQALNRIREIKRHKRGAALAGGRDCVLATLATPST